MFASGVPVDMLAQDFGKGMEEFGGAKEKAQRERRLLGICERSSA